jgi:flagellar biosynthesis/type III secretory pathway protein FliH
VVNNESADKSVRRKKYTEEKREKYSEERTRGKAQGFVRGPIRKWCVLCLTPQ